MGIIAEHFAVIHTRLDALAERSSLCAKPPTVIAVSKRQPPGRINQALAYGHRHFGENQVQEAQRRWQSLRTDYPDLTLHLIGPLQSNKVADAVALFDVIHTVDREKIARAIAESAHLQKRAPHCLIQVNIGQEPQKSGVAIDDLAGLLACCHELALPISGLMAIPPRDKPPAAYFALMHQLATRHQLKELSMGMSDDYEEALRFGATYIRLGTALFGPREEA